jgi:hypothetical protein
VVLKGKDLDPLQLRRLEDEIVLATRAQASWDPF